MKKQHRQSKEMWTYQKKQLNLKQCSKELPNSDVPPYLGYSLGKEAKNMGLSI